MALKFGLSYRKTSEAGAGVALKTCMSRPGFLFLAIFMFILDTGNIHAQNRLSTPIKLTITDGDYEGVTVVLKNNTTGESQSLPGVSRFDLELKYNCDYVVSFSKPGYITKKISLNTTVPASRARQGFHPFPYEVILFKQYDGVNIVIFNQPVGKISYNRLIDDYDYDTDYTKQIQSALKAAEEEIRQKQKEQEKLSAKQRKEEEKLRIARDEEARALAKQQAEEERKLALEAKKVAEQAAKEKKVQEEQQKKQLLATQEEEKRKPRKAVEGSETRPQPIPVGADEGKQGNHANSGLDSGKSGSPTGSGDDMRSAASAAGDAETNKVKISQASGEDNKLTDPGTGYGTESRHLMLAQAEERDDGGFTMAKPVVVSEEKPVATSGKSIPGTAQSEYGKFEVLPDISVQEIRETNRIITKVTVRKDSVETLFTRVTYAWGGTYYFRQNISISENLFFINTGMR
jgi:hypothetical protein